MAATMITSDMLKALAPNKTISGVVLLKEINVALTKSDKEYMVGKVQSGIEIPFKAWNNSSAFSKLKAENYNNVPTYITGTVDNYGGSLSIILDSVQAVEGFTPDMFLPIRYNIEAYWEALKTGVKSKCTDKAYAIADTILFANESVASRFKEEFAAKSHHDNCKGGLLAHTYKVVQGLNFVLGTYQGLVTKDGVVQQDFVDLLFVGAVLHDLGKIFEYNFGSVTSASIATHHMLGAELIMKQRDLIVGSFSEDWYYNLLSIVSQHHGEFGEPCKSVAAYIIHRADELDSSFTLLTQVLEAPTVQGEFNDVKFNGQWLRVY